VYKTVLDQQEEEYEKELQQLMMAAERELGAERENTNKLQQVRARPCAVVYHCIVPSRIRSTKCHAASLSTT
jgi:hypothetical protein